MRLLRHVQVLRLKHQDLRNLIRLKLVDIGLINFKSQTPYLVSFPEFMFAVSKMAPLPDMTMLRLLEMFAKLSLKEVVELWHSSHGWIREKASWSWHLMHHHWRHHASS